MTAQPPTNNNDELRDSILKLFGAYLTNGHWNIEPVEVAEKIVQSCHRYAQKMVRRGILPTKENE